MCEFNERDDQNGVKPTYAKTHRTKYNHAYNLKMENHRVGK